MWQDVVGEMANDLDQLLSQKVTAIQNLMSRAEELYTNHTFDENLDIDYYNNKKILSDDEVAEMEASDDLSIREMSAKFQSLELEPGPKFNNVPINPMLSTIHVPTNVFDRSPSVMNGVHWTDGLNREFIENNNNDGTLKWQYFCSSDGFFRVFPGMKWPRNNEGSGIDLFDCRLRSWYLQAATCPKNLVLLVDTSGSMKGLRMEITRSTVQQILDTLSDEDYFNIIRFTDTLDYIDHCFDRTMVPASSQNKQRLQEAMDENVKAKNTANFEQALLEAFRLLEHEPNRRNNRSLCNKAILLITDGVPENYEEVFEKHNWPNKTIRVFTYLIGREISDYRQVKWMACANKGFYSHISTLADVKENVQNYIKVLSRPMVIQRAHNVVWTSIYLDHMSALDNNQGLKFMTSVSVPVFDTKNDTVFEGNLLGVMGTDVPIEEMKKVVPSYKLGVNGYTFLINHNGYVLFHPDFKPFRKSEENEDVTLHPNYNNMDLMDIMLPINRRQLVEMRINILSSVSGSKEFDLLVQYDGMKRMAKRRYSFFYHKVGETDFHLGLALPQISLTQVKSANFLPTVLHQCLNGSRVEIAPWQYCKGLNSKLTGRARINKLLELSDNKLYKQQDDHCDHDLMTHLTHDGKVTEGLIQKWMHMGNSFGSRHSKTSNVFNIYKSKGVELVFIGTKGGLTKYLDMEQNLTDPNFLKDNLNTVEAPYYKRAVEGTEQLDGQETYKFTYSVPLDKPFNMNTTMVTASAPIVTHRDDKFGVGAVVGLQMKYQNFYDLFMTETSTCMKPPCTATCLNNSLNCYLIDNHGYVIASKLPDFHVGHFFGDVEPALMTEFIMKHRIFKGYNYTDHQAICDIKRYETEKSSANFLLNPLRALFNAIVWAVMEISLFLTEFNFSSLLHSNHVRAQECMHMDVEDSEITNMNPRERHIFDLLQRECVSEMMKNQVVGHRACLKHYMRYTWNLRPLKNNGRRGTLINAVSGCNRCLAWSVCEEDEEDLCHPICLEPARFCHKTFTVSWIKDTNLLLVVTTSDCECDNVMPFNIKPVEIDNQTPDETCSKLKDKNAMYRHTMAACQDYSEEEDDKTCGQGRINFSIVLLYLSILVSSLIAADL